MEDNSTGLVTLTSAIVGAFVGNNAISQGDLPALIATVHGALRSADEPETVTADAPVKLTVAQIRRSITPAALISFEDGQGYKLLKRHLTSRGMTVAEYRAKWGLPKDYPTTASDHSAKRSALAKAIGLGQFRGKSSAATIAKPLAETTAKPKAAGVAPPAPTRRARTKKTATKAS